MLTGTIGGTTITGVGGSIKVGDIEGVKEALKALQEVQPTLVKALRQKAMDAGRHIEVQISLDRPTISDVGSGWDHKGRSSLNQPLEFKRKLGGNPKPGGRSIPLLKIQVLTPAIAIIEFAGKPGSFNRKPRSRAYRGRPQGHLLNDQGKFMVARLNKGGKQPGRYIWPAAEKALPAAQREALEAVKDIMNKANMNMVVR
jgi:hypothetical protein